MADDINKTKKEVEALIKTLTSQADVSYYQSLFDSLNKNQGNIEQFQKLMSQVKDDVDETRGNLNYVTQSFKNIVEELKGAKGPLNSQISSLNKISNIARQALEVRRGENVLSGKQLENLQLRNKREIDNLIRLKESGSIQGKALQNLKDQIKAAKEVDDAFEEIKKTEEEVNKELGFGPKLLGGLDKAMQKLGLPNLGFDDALKKTKAMAQEAKANGEKFNATKAYISNIKDNLKEAFTSANLLQAAGMALLNSMQQVDKMTGDTAKNLGISYKASLSLNSSFTGMAATSDNIFVTTKGINESFNQINSALGTNGVLSKDILISQTELVKQAGYSVEAATMLSKLSLATGKPTKAITAEFLGQARALNLTNKTAINEKQLLEDISGLSKDTLATFAGQPAKLAEAAYEARKLGLSLDKLKGTQSALLDIESSIAAEFEAEVMTGKQLNLEKARYFALTNDYAGLAKELQAQDITRDSFSKMNVLQQEATAKAMGMTAETMGGMLMDQEAMSKLSGIDGDNAKEKFDNLVKQVGLEEAKKRLGNDVLAQQMASASTQDRLVAITEKLKEAFVSIAEPVMAFVSPLVDLLSTVLTPMFNILTGIGGIITSLFDPTQSIVDKFAEMGPLASFIAAALTAAGIAVSASLVPGLIRAGIAALSALPSMISMAIAAISSASAATLGIGAIAIAAGIAAVVASMSSAKSSMDDGMVGPDGGMILSGKKGSIQLNKDDSVIAGTNLLPSGGGRAPQPQSQAIDYDKMAQAMSRVKVQTNLDGVDVSRGLQKAPLGIATRKL
jgi:hypothetical protein